MLFLDDDVRLSKNLVEAHLSCYVTPKSMEWPDRQELRVG